jgi:predicted NBD/HSP70 family sugar kinase
MELEVESVTSITAARSGNNREDLRQHNLSVVLNLVHKYRSISRSEITFRTGLNRSTTLDLVGQLVQLGLVEENEGANSKGVGRPSINVTPVESVVSFSVVPTAHNVTVAVVSMAGSVLMKARETTSIFPPADEVAKVAADIIAGLRKRLKPGTRVAGVGVSIPGQVNISTNTVRNSPHLKWIEEPFGLALEDLVKLPVRLDNNGSITSAAERDFGAGRGFENIVYLLGTDGGIGGGVVMDGKLIRGSTGYAGELGHMRISESKLEDSMGLTGTLEAIVRRTEIEEVLGLDDPDDEELSRAIRTSKSPRVRRTLDRQIELLGVGVANLVNIFNPEVVLLGGFLSDLFNVDDYKLISQIRRSALPGAREKVQIRTAELGANLQIIGAAQLGFANLLEDPAGATLHTP